LKKVTILIVFAIIISITAFGAFEDVPPNGEHSDAIERLVRYGVLNGKGNNLFDPNGVITRAEMAKVSTVIAGLDSEAAANSGISLFSDMQDGYWASGFVNVAAKKQIILGYPDGSFAPEKTLTFSEATTVILRLLGYSTEELGNNWPDAYMFKAFELGLTSGINAGYYDYISRADIALITDRALLMDINRADGQSQKKLIELMNYTVSQECIILATSNESKNLLSDEVSTTTGVYKKLDDTVNNFVTRKVRLVLNNDNKVLGVIPAGPTGQHIIVQSVVGSELAYTQDGKAASIKLGDNSVVYHLGTKKTFQEVKPAMETGMTMAVYFSQSGEYDYSVIKDFEMLGPFVINSDFNGTETAIDNYPLSAEGLRVIRDGFDASLSDIKAFDVVYYNRVSNIVYVYCDKISGVYQEALPNKASVTGIVLSGVTYELETQAAARLLGEQSGAYKLNEYMTLLLGKDGKVVSVVDVNAVDYTVYGIILSAGSKISDDEKTKGATQYYINAFTVNGTEQTFITDQNYSDYRGRIIKYNFKDGLMVPQFMQTKKISGRIDVKNRTIGGQRLAKDAKLVDLVYAPAINVSGAAMAKLTDLSEIAADSLTDGDVAFVLSDSKFNEIQFIVFNNITLSRYQFGVITKKSGSETVINIKGVETSFRGKNFAPKEGQAVMASIQNNSLTELKALTQLPTKGVFEAIDVQKIRVGEESYPLSQDVSILLYNDFKYFAVPLDDMDSRDISSIQLYADRLPSDGGLVRVIVFRQ